MNSSSHNTIGDTHNTSEEISDVLEQIEEISLHDEEEKIEETHHTLDHTPVLSDDMQIFSHKYEYEAHNKKRKTKIKAFLSYFAGGISIFALSVFGFISGAPSQKNFSANLTTHTEISEEFKTEDECLLIKIKQNSHAKLEKIQKICSDLFTKNTH